MLKTLMTKNVKIKITDLKYIPFCKNVFYKKKNNNYWKYILLFINIIIYNYGYNIIYSDIHRISYILYYKQKSDR